MAQETKKDLIKQTTGVSIRNKMLFWLLLIALLPTAVISYVQYKLSADSLHKLTFDRLESTLALQQQALNDYFTERVKNLKNITDNVDAAQKRTYAALSAVKNTRHNVLKKYVQEHVKDVEVFSYSPQQKKVVDEFMKDPSTGLDATFLSFLKSWTNDRDFDSFMLVSVTGKVLYATNQDAKNNSIVKGDSPEWLAFKNGSQKGTFTGYGISSIYDDEPAAYVSAPVKQKGKLSAVLLFKLKNDAFDKIMKDTLGLGETGETYLVGPDGMFRSNSRYFEESTLLNPAFLVDTESVAEALIGIDGERVVVNYRGEYVLSSYMPLEIQGTTWALITEIDQHEAVAPKLDKNKADYLTRVSENYGFPDLYLIDPDGYVFYSTKQAPDYQTNLLAGPYADSGLTETINKVLETKGIVISDYSLYKPAGSKPAAFLAEPIIHDNEVTMIVAYQIPLDQIGAIMSSQVQFAQEGSSGDTYLIGQDKLWRTESLQTQKYNVKTTLLNPKVKVDSEAVTDALAGIKGTRIISNGLGEKVLSSWAPFTFKGLQWAIISEIGQDEVEGPINKLLRTIALLAGLAGLAVIGVSLWVAGGITRQIKSIMTVMKKVEEGDYEDRARITSNDELGSMASSFNHMIDTTKNLIQNRQEEHEQLQESIMGLLGEISDVADGDLTVRATVQADATGTVADSLNIMFEELSGAIGKIKKSSEEVGATAENLSASTNKLAIQSDAQSEIINDAAKEITQMTLAIELAAEQAGQSAETSGLSIAAATEGTKAVEDTSRAMEAIRNNVQDTARAIKRLGESSQEISDFTRTINEISDRTSILALNASIQAAAAGDAGHGFAVVAEEIQRLAERTAGSTKQIETLIRNILGEITEAGVSMDASIQEVVSGTALSEDALAKLQDINKRSSEVANLIDSVSGATEKQAKSSAKVAKSMTDIGVIITDTAEETRKTSSSMREMAAVADEMLQSVSVFNLPEAEGKTTEEVVVSESPLVTELKKEHGILTKTLKEVKMLGIDSKEGRNKLLASKNALLAHLKKEDESIYPILNEKAKNDTYLKSMLEVYYEDMKEISAYAIEFFGKYSEGGSILEFTKDFETLYASLAQRISNEEKMLYKKYDEIHQQRMMATLSQTLVDEDNEPISLESFMDFDEEEK